MMPEYWKVIEVMAKTNKVELDLEELKVAHERNTADPVASEQAAIITNIQGEDITSDSELSQPQNLSHHIPRF